MSDAFSSKEETGIAPLTSEMGRPCFKPSILASGTSRRFCGDKQQQELDVATLLRSVNSELDSVDEVTFAAFIPLSV
ncbi:uncharacterized protein PHALS_02548 [Plasmopara halstedii]|uniref:Uncharacterized protein n=1 Tax=Plasmopara halstedii TaxID=4781 RepID=A0A0P1AWX9_PLAHL|nr:uncharacterized protein PHALS_02548 [Plasmopara halstedii]CEG46126.1 hypothetical protein PHALS_02548 [Plasmopara halstedii]|eukprot:XP_024582495.1 hypothetical protein PHALS_02548 [Plasmopara halstedii]